LASEVIGEKRYEIGSVLWKAKDDGDGDLRIKF